MGSEKIKIMAEFSLEKKIFQKKEKPRPDDKRNIFKEGMEEVEENKKLIKKEKIRKYIDNYTYEGKVLESLKKDPNFLIELYRDLRGKRFYVKALKNLERLKIVKIEEKELVKEIHPENLEKVWEKNRTAKILKFIEEKEFITVSQITKMRKDWSDNVIRKEVNKLDPSG